MISDIDYTGGYATYCPEDDKLRLYVGRVPRDEYDALRSEGWTSTPKQDCDFVAVWTPGREDTALAYSGGTLEDEDTDPTERAADRAERFGGYRDNRRGDAAAHGDRYDSGPGAHGYQSRALAERRAARHDLCASRAVVAWDKAEYWQQRTAGVIRHALHKCAPGVRMGRIKTIEAEIRAAEKSRDEYAKRYSDISKLATWPESEENTEKICAYFGRLCSLGREYMHPRPDDLRAAITAAEHPRAEQMIELYTTRKDDIYSMMTSEYAPVTGAEACALWLSDHDEPAGEGRHLAHLRLRLEYENQMLEEQGGRAAHVEMIAGGFFGGRQIHKINKSPSTGRVVSVAVRVPRVDGYAYRVRNQPGQDYALEQINTERLSAEHYRAPTPEELAAYEAERKAERATRKATGPKPPPIINLTDADAERLQAIWSADAKARNLFWTGEELPRVRRLTQAQYSALATCSLSRAETIDITGGGTPQPLQHYSMGPRWPTVARIRGARRSVVILTDKPQKPLPAEMWTDPRPALRDELRPRIEEIAVMGCSSDFDDQWTDEKKELFRRAQMAGLVRSSSMTQRELTGRGAEMLAAHRTAKTAPKPTPRALVAVGQMELF